MEIGQLTLGQLGVYLRKWASEAGEAKQKNSEGVTDIDMFNIMAGIPKKIVQKK